MRYTVADLSGPFGLIVDHAEGRWDFIGDQQQSALTDVPFFARPYRGWMPAAFVRALWAGYMRRCAALCVERAGQR